MMPSCRAASEALSRACGLPSRLMRLVSHRLVVVATVPGCGSASIVGWHTFHRAPSQDLRLTCRWRHQRWSWQRDVGGHTAMRTPTTSTASASAVTRHAGHALTSCILYNHLSHTLPASYIEAMPVTQKTIVLPLLHKTGCNTCGRMTPPFRKMRLKSQGFGCAAGNVHQRR